MNDLQKGRQLDPARHDLAWETELVQLLSTLESFRAQLQDDCHAGRALPAVEAMLAVAKGVAGFVRARFGDGSAETRAAADAFFAAARPCTTGSTTTFSRRCGGSCGGAATTATRENSSWTRLPGSGRS